MEKKKKDIHENKLSILQNCIFFQSDNFIKIGSITVQKNTIQIGSIFPP